MKNEGDPEQPGAKAVDLLRQITESAEDVIFIIDEDRSLRFCSVSQTSAKFSRPASPLHELACTDIYEALREPVETVFKSGKSLSVERRLGQPGREIWLHALLTPITEGSAKISSVLGIVRDICELKRKEELIAHSRAEWLQAVDAMPDLLAVIDLDFQIKRANRALAEHLGIRLHDLHSLICHQTLGTKCPPESCPLQRSRLIDRQGPADFQSNLLGRPFLVTVSPLTDGSGNTTGCLFLARDLKGRPDAEEIRKENAKDMKLLLARAEYVVTVQDQNGKYLSIRALPGNVGMPGAIIGKTPYDFFESEAADKICERIRKAIGAGRDLTVSSELKLGGETFYLLEHISPVGDETGNVSSVMTISKGISGVREKRKAMPDEPRAITKREHEILQLISSALTTSQIAEKLFISKKTVETHRSRIMRKLGIHKTSGLVRYVVESGLF
jgi:DNA-binding CsgD family transcriptional regulator/PAS domain-containing protein